MISSEQVRRAVDLAGIPAAERERYGRNLFGQSVLLGRRLLDAGARLGPPDGDPFQSVTYAS